MTKRKKQKIQNMLIAIITIIVIAIIVAVVYKKFKPQTADTVSFKQFEQWMGVNDISQTEYMEVCVQNVKGQEEKEENYYVIKDKKAMNKLWKALKTSDIRVVEQSENIKENGVFWKISMYNKENCPVFSSEQLEDGTRQVYFTVLEKNGYTPLQDGSNESYQYQAYTFQTDISNVIQEVIQDEIKQLDIDTLKQMASDGLEMQELEQYYHVMGITNNEIKTEIKKGSGNLAEFELKEEGYCLIIHYRMNVDIENESLDDTVTMARLYQPDGTYEELMEELPESDRDYDE